MLSYFFFSLKLPLLLPFGDGACPTITTSPGFKGLVGNISQEFLLTFLFLMFFEIPRDPFEFGD